MKTYSIRTEPVVFCGKDLRAQHSKQEACGLFLILRKTMSTSERFRVAPFSVTSANNMLNSHLKHILKTYIINMRKKDLKDSCVSSGFMHYIRKIQIESKLL